MHEDYRRHGWRESWYRRQSGTLKTEGAPAKSFETWNRTAATPGIKLSITGAHNVAYRSWRRGFLWRILARRVVCSCDGASTGIQDTDTCPLDESGYSGDMFTTSANRSAASCAIWPMNVIIGAASPVIMLSVIRSDTTSWRLRWSFCQ